MSTDETAALLGLFEDALLPGETRTFTPPAVDGGGAHLTHLRSEAKSNGVAEERLRGDVHVHRPGGGMGKDGRSAGVRTTMVPREERQEVPAETEAMVVSMEQWSEVVARAFEQAGTA